MIAGRPRRCWRLIQSASNGWDASLRRLPLYRCRSASSGAGYPRPFRCSTSWSASRPDTTSPPPGWPVTAARDSASDGSAWVSRLPVRVRGPRGFVVSCAMQVLLNTANDNNRSRPRCNAVTTRSCRRGASRPAPATGHGRPDGLVQPAGHDSSSCCPSRPGHRPAVASASSGLAQVSRVTPRWPAGTPPGMLSPAPAGGSSAR